MSPKRIVLAGAQAVSLPVILFFETRTKVVEREGFQGTAKVVAKVVNLARLKGIESVTDELYTGASR